MLTEIKVYFHALLKMSWEPMEVKPLRLVSHSGSAPGGPDLPMVVVPLPLLGSDFALGKRLPLS